MNSSTKFEWEKIFSSLYLNEKPTLNQRLTRTNIPQELLIKAIGKGRYKTVLDTTAGLGRDALIMASVSEKIVLLERHPKIFQGLEQTLTQAHNVEALQALLQRIELIHICAIEFLKTYSGPGFEVIYCDPMFPKKTKSALPKKESQYLQSIIGTDEDAEMLIEVALSKAQNRVVVKRPLQSPVLIKKPTMQYKARAHRFDVYVC